MISKTIIGFAAGVGVGAVVFASLGAAAPAKPEVRRFQVGICHHHAIIIDTATGKTWEKQLDPNSGMTSNGFEEPKAAAE